jgi:DNA-binding NtrC family response regulator
VKLSDAEREHILKTLKENHGNRTKSAFALGISVRCLRMKLKLYRDQNIEVAEFNPLKREECMR